ncbi:MAG: Gfo/Idh/MocA family oxidoreductase [Candidatus Margulisbacteria bacterium]|nr:Gfo/Idh/MocA family oxidoreductase [Candidatus Margulisiibacteriota bacterium]
MKKVRVGVIGVGVMGGYHAQNYADLKEAKLIGIYDRDEKRAQEVAEKYQTISYRTPEELIAQCEALSVCSPTSTHLEMAKTCLEAGRHTLVEKPLATTEEDAQSLVALARSKKIVLAVGMIERFNPALMKAQGILKKDVIIGIKASRQSPLPQRITDADVIEDVMVHDLDLANFLAASPLESVKATAERIATEKFDKARATLYFKSGTIAKILANRVHDTKERKLTVTTNNAIVEIDLLNKKLFVRSFENINEKQHIEIEPANQLHMELKDFLLAIRNKRPPKTAGEDGARLIGILQEVKRKI